MNTRTFPDLERLASELITMDSTADARDGEDRTVEDVTSLAEAGLELANAVLESMGEPIGEALGTPAWWLEDYAGEHEHAEVCEDASSPGAFLAFTRSAHAGPLYECRGWTKETNRAIALRISKCLDACAGRML